jgi:hypothetical protein
LVLRCGDQPDQLARPHVERDAVEREHVTAEAGDLDPCSPEARQFCQAFGSVKQTMSSPPDTRTIQYMRLSYWFFLQ